MMVLLKSEFSSKPRVAKLTIETYVTVMLFLLYKYLNERMYWLQFTNTMMAIALAARLRQFHPDGVVSRRKKKSTCCISGQFLYFYCRLAGNSLRLMVGLPR